MYIYIYTHLSICIYIYTGVYIYIHIEYNQSAIEVSLHCELYFSVPRAPWSFLVLGPHWVDAPFPRNELGLSQKHVSFLVPGSTLCLNPH